MVTSDDPRKSPSGHATREAPRLSLGTFPTRVHVLPGLSTASTELWVKRDDESGALYGGNKVRKLEYILAGARREGKSRLLTVGAAGSHHVLATAIYGRRMGFSVAAVLVPQPSSPHALQNLEACVAQGLEPIAASGFAEVPLQVLAAMDGRTAFVALGGSSATGTLGYVSAAAELADQIARGELPIPDVIVTALGSGGTVAGLALGLTATGLRTRVHAVAVSAPVPLIRFMTSSLIKRVARGLPGVSAEQALGRVTVDGGFLGKGYGFLTEDGERASDEAQGAGLTLDPTYTAKAFAAALARVRAGPPGTVLFWHTLSSAPLGPLLRGAPEPTLDPELLRLFR